MYINNKNANIFKIFLNNFSSKRHITKNELKIELEKIKNISVKTNSYTNHINIYYYTEVFYNNRLVADMKDFRIADGSIVIGSMDIEKIDYVTRNRIVDLVDRYLYTPLKKR